MKKIIALFMVLMLVVAMTACASTKTETVEETEKVEIETKEESEKVEIETEEESVEEEIEQAPVETEPEVNAEPEVETEETETKPSGVWEDGMGEDPSYGEGIGEVIALSDEEKLYVMAQDTNTWLEMSQEEKDDLVVLMGRWMEDVTGYIVEDYDDMVKVLDHQMEQYFKNGVNEGVMKTVGDIYQVAMPLDDPALQVGERPSGVWDDGIGEVVPLTPEEESFVLNWNTNTWLDLNSDEKDELVVLIGRWLEANMGYIVEDYDELVFMLDHQMEQYYRNGVNEKILDTVIDILGLAL